MRTTMKLCGALAVATCLFSAPAMAEDPPLCTALGKIVWKQQLGSTRADHVVRVGTDDCGNVTVFGDTAGWLAATNQGGKDIFIAKYHDSGKLLWKRQRGTTGDDIALAMATNPAGESIMLWTNSSNWFLTKHDKYGRLVWERKFSSSGNTPKSIAFADANTIVAVVDDGRGGAHIEKFSSTGVPLWISQIVWGGWPTHVVSDGKQSIYAGTQQDDVMIIWNFSLRGALRWQKYVTDWISQGLWGQFYDLVIDRGGNLLIREGHLEHFWADEDVWTHWVDSLRKWRSDGSEVWSVTPRGEEENIAADGTGNVVSTGAFNGDGWVSRRSGATGATLWDCRFGTAQADVPTDIVADRNGNIFVGGNTNGSLGATQKGGGDAFVVKLKP